MIERLRALRMDTKPLRETDEHAVAERAARAAAGESRGESRGW